ncbi:pre-mRNA splicing factor, partial [Lentinula raphanica]
MSNSNSQKPDLSQYNYGAISSLVLTADRSVLPRRDKEPDGAPTSLAGRIDVKEMGSRVMREKPAGLDKKGTKGLGKTRGSGAKTAHSKGKTGEEGSRETAFGFSGYADIIEATQQVEGLTYRPRTIENRQVYELLLAEVYHILGGQAQDVVRTAADAVLEVLKDDEAGKKDFDKKKEVEKFLGQVDSETFGRMVGLAKKITDYHGIEDGEGGGEDERPGARTRGEGDIDDEVGVAVVFDEEDEESDDEERTYEVRDGDDDDDSDADKEGEDEDAEGDSTTVTIEGGEENIALGRSSLGADPDLVSPHQIDAFWVQRQISEHYPDPVTSASLASTAIRILSSPDAPDEKERKSLRDVENQLMDLFDYETERFGLVRKFVKNREVIVWCTRLARSGSDEEAGERKDVEVAMREKGLGWILRELKGERKGPTASLPSGQDDRMDVDGPDEKSGKILKGKAGIDPTKLKTIDLSAMAFSQGGHLMSNKKCVLPEGSFKRLRKGWEEVHVPAAKSRYSTTVDELVPITSLPPWAQAAFTVPNLNRVQSKLFPVAFGTDEPILLCAPTGAGKTNVALL